MKRLRFPSRLFTWGDGVCRWRSRVCCSCR